MSITGQTYLHYRIIEKIGEGGMGAVYKAEDTHLDRIVAIKVLPHDKMTDIERKQRFVQEAKAASSLNHPNIITVHDITSDQGLDLMVMEYVAGKTLAELIGRKGLKLNEALAVAVQIADGLSQAHAAGIVHRDLKPGNIMVTDDGRVKILDFGLVKLLEDAPSAHDGATMTLDQQDKPRTEEGYILGTVAYMSPEQAEGKKVDARSDVFSFGSVLYEMLTGQKAFLKETRVSTMAAILNEEPRPSPQVDDDLPREVKQALIRCLRKDPGRRWQNMSDLKVVLQDLKEDSESGKLRVPQTAVTRRKINPLAWLSLGAIAAAAALFIWLFLPNSTVPVEYEITRLTFDSGLSWSPSISMDGTMFAYASDRSGEGHSDIWVQQMAGGPPLRLTTHAAFDDFPDFSPDGSKLAFRSTRDGGGIYEIATLGGQPRRIADRGRIPRYSPDGKWISLVFVPASLEDKLKNMFLVPAQGGELVPFQPDFYLVNLATNLGPAWSPDGRHLIFNGRKEGEPDSFDWWVAPVDGGPAKRTGAHENLAIPPIWMSPYAWVGSYIYFSTGTTVEGVNIFRAHIDDSSWKVTGPIERVTSGAGMQFYVSARKNGPIIYANMNWIANIWAFAADTDQGTIKSDSVPLTSGAMAKFHPSLSRDGAKLVYATFGGVKRARSEVRIKDLNSGEERLIPMLAARTGQNPILSHDGRMLAFRDIKEGKRRTFIMHASETTGREVCDSCNILDFFPDANFALIQEQSNRFHKLNLTNGEKTILLETQSGFIKDPAVSPRGDWIAFILGKPDGKAALYTAFVGAGLSAESDWVLLFEDDHYIGSPAWSPGSNRIYFLSEKEGDSSVWLLRFDPATKKPAGGLELIYKARSSDQQINFPPGNGRIAVGKDKLILWMAEGTSNIYMATPKKK